MEPKGANGYEKLSSSKPVIFRPGSELRAAILKLAADLSYDGAKVTPSDILRDGLNVFWPQIRAWHLARKAENTMTNEEIDRSVAAITKARQFGLAIDEIEAALTAAISEKVGERSVDWCETAKTSAASGA